MQISILTIKHIFSQIPIYCSEYNRFLRT